VKEKDIDKILQEIKVPEPDEVVKRATIKASVGEFNRQKESLQKNIKGIETERRLIGRINLFLNFLGGFAMRKSYVIVGGATAFVAILVVSLTYLSVDLNRVPPAVNVPVEREAAVVDSGIAEKPTSGPGTQYQVNRERARQYALAEKLASGPRGTTSSGGAAGMHQEAYDYSYSEPQGGGGISYYKSAMPPSPSVGMGSSGMGSSIHNMIAEVPMNHGGSSYSSEGYTEEGLRSHENRETGRDQFDTIDTNPVKQVKEDPVSTFSIDVDTASYAFVRRQINYGLLPQENAVRIEEMINYFDYDYVVPEDRTRPFQPTIAVYPTPWNSDSKLLHIGIKGYDIVPEEKPVSNLVFLIDVSGSMDDQDKLPLLKNSFRLLVNSLDEEDTVAVVVYAGAAGTVLEPTSVKEKGKILAAIDQMQAGGSTAGGEGIQKAYDLAEANFKKDGVNRIILATDGDFNVGIYDDEELKSFIDRKRKSGIFLSVLGFGQGNYNDALMQKLAQNGNGNASYIDNLNEARKVLVDEAGSTLFTIARDVKLQIEFNPKLIAEYRLIGYESRMLKREDFNNDKVDAGDIGSGHTVTAIYEIIPVGSKGKLVDDLRYGSKEKKEVGSELSDSEYAFLKIRYKLPDSEKSELITTSVSKVNEYAQLDQVSADVRFAASVAAFGQVLRGGTYTDQFTYDNIIKLAESTVGNDKFGYRHEFLGLVRLAKSIE
jgi:Ca-activated chloride channel homolog